MTKAIIFDFDGTIADTLPATIELFNPIAKENGLPQITGQNIDELRDSSAKELVTKYRVSPLRLLKFEREIQEKIHDQIDNIPIITGMKTVIDNLNKMGLVTGIVTSNSRKNVEIFCKEQKIEVNIIHSEKNIFGKSKVLIHLLKNLRFLPSEAIYVGDEVRDIEAAQKAGMKVAAVTWGFNSEKRLRDAKPDAIISKPEELYDQI